MFCCKHCTDTWTCSRLISRHPWSLYRWKAIIIYHVFLLHSISSQFYGWKAVTIHQLRSGSSQYTASFTRSMQSGSDRHVQNVCALFNLPLPVWLTSFRSSARRLGKCGLWQGAYSRASLFTFTIHQLWIRSQRVLQWISSKTNFAFLILVSTTL